MADDSRDAEPTRPTGWYPDADDPDGTMRWWDGNAWTTSRPRLAADGPATQAATSETPGDPSAPTPPAAVTARPEGQAGAQPPVKKSKPFWRNPRVWAAVVVIVVGGAGFIGRHFSSLDDTRSGTQQQWVDYFDRARSAVSTFNNASSRSKDLGSAFDTLATSPDDALNKEARAAKERCVPRPRSDCRSAMTTLVSDYNAAIQEASDKGLVKIDK